MDDWGVRLSAVERLVASVAVIAVVAVATSAASAQVLRGPGSELALVPLSRALIGHAANSLPLAGWGSISNADSAGSSDGQLTVHGLARAGRVIGYGLTYGDDLTRAAPVSQIESNVDEWRSARDARRGFAQLIRINRALAGLSRFGLRATVVPTSGEAVGAQHFAFRETYFFPPVAPVLHCANELIRDGRHTMFAGACGTSEAATEQLDPILARRIDERLHLALAGKLHGKPVGLPGYHQPKPGPPRRGTKPAALALTPLDLPAKARRGAYVKTGFLSQYDLSLSHAGPYVALYEQIALNINSTHAMFWEARFLWADTHQGTYEAENNGPPEPIHPGSIDLPGVGDHALGQIVRIGPYPGGAFSYHGHIVLRRGRWLAYITADSNSPIPASKLRTLAQLAAQRLNNGPHG
jgi:hypothetical protein